MYHPVPLEAKEVHNKQAAEDEPDTYYAELRPEKQPRARSTALSAQSLSSTTRPAGSGSLCRAGLSTRLVSSSWILCLIPVSLCDLNVNEAEITKKDLPLNVTETLITFLPLYASLSLLANMDGHDTVDVPAEKQMYHNAEDLPLYVMEPLSTFLPQQNVTEPLITSLSLLAKMEPYQREGLHNGTSGGSGPSTGTHQSQPPALAPKTWD